MQTYRSVVKRCSISFRIRKNSTDSEPDVVSLLSAVFRMGIITQSMVQWKKRSSRYKYASKICNKVFLKLHQLSRKIGFKPSEPKFLTKHVHEEQLLEI